MSRLEFSIAWRYLRSHRRSRRLSFITIIAVGGVVVGVSALIVIIGVMNGLQNDLRDKILVGSPDLRVLTFGADLKMSAWRTTLDKVRREPGIVAAAPEVISQGLINVKGHDYNAPVVVNGLAQPAHGTPAVTDVRDYAVAGDFRFRSSDGTQDGVVLGKRLAEQLDVYLGDTVTLVSGANVKMNQALGAYIPQFHEYQVTGIVSTGMYEYDDTYAYLSLAAAQQFAGLGDAVTGIAARTASRSEAPAVGAALDNLLGLPYRVITWQDQNSSLFQAFKLEKLGMGVILLLIVVVAAFNIVSTLTMVVKDKTREIGILKAMGMTSHAVRRVFVLQGLAIGVLGTGLGALIGLGAAVLLDRYKFISLDPSIYFIDHLPVTVQATDVLWIVLASVAIAALATLYPSNQAARLFPVEAIRHE
ncbi:MAG TPA: ABC transporter permease [Gemmatimonadaceae bacterium]|nr:ABC transporter permease [Gemmatimonadaceae bacterium]